MREFDALKGLTGLTLVVLLAVLPASAAGVAVVSTLVYDNGDHDGFADTQETVTVRLVVRNTSSVDLDNVTARLTTTDGAIACLTQPAIAIGTLAAGVELTTGDGFVFMVAPHVQRAAVADDLSVRFALSIEAPGSGELATPPWIDLDLDLDVSGGGGPTTYFESFEDGFGSFTTMHLDEPLNPPDSDLANRAAGTINAEEHRCQYDDPHLSFGAAQGEQCFPNPNGAPDAFYFDVVSDRAFTGTQSMAYNVFLDPVAGYTTPNSQLEAIQTTDPIGVAWDGACSITLASCDEGLDCPTGEACVPAAPRLSFKHQVSLLDHRSVNAQTGHTADRAIVGVQLAANDGSPVGHWIKAYPFVNAYDSQANSNYFNCSFDPMDDGNTEFDFFDPSDPLRSHGPSSTCAPEFSFAHQGDTDDPHDPTNVGGAEPGTGLGGNLGTGTWVEPIIDLGRFRGRRIRVRFLESGLKLGGAHNWEQAFNHNPDPGDDGWFIDDVTITDALADPAIVSVDVADNSDLPFDLVEDTESDGVFDVCDNCPATGNPFQGDRDRDGIGDACDWFPDDQDNDLDGDGLPVLDDNCPDVANADQSDIDGDDHGDLCDSCPLDFNLSQDRDEDEDGVECPADNCNRVANAGQLDEDLDGVGDACDRCLGDPVNDPDGDEVCDLQDSCPFVPNPSQGLGIEVLPDVLPTYVLSPDETVLVGLGGLPGIRLFSVPAFGGEVVTLSTLSIQQYALTADGSTVVYRGSGFGAEVGLYTVPILGGIATRLGLEVSDGRVLDFVLSPDGSRVVYLIEVGQPGATSDEVYSVSSQGGPSVMLGPAPTPGVDSKQIRVSGDGSRALFIRGSDELNSVAIDGGPPVRLTPPLLPARQIVSAEFVPDGSRVVYRADQDQDQVFALYSVPSDGGATPVQISDLQAGGAVAAVSGSPAFRVSPDGTNVVYTADHETNGVFELYQVPIAGGSVRKLNDPLTPFGDIERYEFSPDGSRVAFIAPTQSNGQAELFAVAFDGGSPLLLVDPDAEISTFSFTPDGLRIVYLRGSASGYENALFAVPTAGGPSVPLGEVPGQFIDAGFAISGDGSRVLYNRFSPSKLISVSIDGGLQIDVSDGNRVVSESPLALTHDGSVAYWITSQDVLYASWLDPDPDADGIHTACDCDGSNAAIYPGAPEINDGLDNECPGDEGYGLVDDLGGPAGFDDPDVYSFTPQDGATGYEVVRASDPGFTIGCACRVTTFPDLLTPERPPEGVTFFYLARAFDPNLGSAGADSAGTERQGACLASGCGAGAP